MKIMNNTKILMTFTLLMCSSLNQAMHTQPAQEPGLKDERTITDRRKIAILGYGSLVNDPRTLHRTAAFARTSFTLPVGLTRLSSGNRMTLVIDKDANQRPVWSAISTYGFLPNARIDLAAREDAPMDTQAGRRKLDNISYMKKILSGRQPDSNEASIGYGNWVIRTESNARKRLSADKAKEIARWADNNNVTAVIWASFDPNKTASEALAELRKPDVKRATHEYLQNVSRESLTDSEKRI